MWPSSGLKLASPAVGNAVFIITCLGTFQEIADPLVFLAEINREAVVRRSASKLVLRYFSPVTTKVFVSEISCSGSELGNTSRCFIQHSSS